MSVGEVDLLVGVPSHNNAKTIGPIIRNVQLGLLQHFPRQRVVIVNADGGSRDGTREALTEGSLSGPLSPQGLLSLRTVHEVSTRYAGSPSSGSALRTIFAASDLLRAKACATISASTENLTPAWVESLLRPAYKENFDLVAPTYLRHKFDGLLMRMLVYPMVRALYGQGIREPHAQELGFSGRLASHCLAQDIWDHQTSSGEISMTITAITAGFRCCQAFLGPKLRSTGGSDEVVQALLHTLRPLFGSLESNEASWMSRVGSAPVPTFGPDHDLTLEPLRINRKHLLQMFQNGVSELGPILSAILTAASLAGVSHLASLPEREFRFPDDLWVRAMYDFAASFHHTVMDRDHIIQALTPLYRGKIYSFLVEHHRSSSSEIEEATERLCLEFERQKGYLIERWKGTNRGEQ